MARESAAAVTLGLGHRPLLGPAAVVLAAIAVAVALVNLLLRVRQRSGRVFRMLLLAFTVLLLTLAVLVEYFLIDRQRVEVAGEYAAHTATLLVPRGGGEYAGALVIPSGAGRQAREARLVARFLAERGVAALAVEAPLEHLADAQALFTRLVGDPRVDPVRSGLVAIGEQASVAITGIALATFLVVTAVEADPALAHWDEVHVPLLLLIGAGEDTEVAEARLDAIGVQLTGMTQAETDALVFGDADDALRRSPWRFARGYPQVVAGWVQLIFRLPGEGPGSAPENAPVVEFTPRDTVAAGEAASAPGSSESRD